MIAAVRAAVHQANKSDFCEEKALASLIKSHFYGPQ